MTGPGSAGGHAIGYLPRGGRKLAHLSVAGRIDSPFPASLVRFLAALLRVTQAQAWSLAEVLWAYREHGGLEAFSTSSRK